MADVKPIPDGYPRVTPYLIVDGAGAAIDFYGKVLGATERMRMPSPGGKIGHAELEIGDSLIMLADEHPEMGAAGAEDRRRHAGDHQRLRRGRRRRLRAGPERRCDLHCARSRTSSTATAPGSSRTRSGTSGASPPMSRTCRRKRWSSAPPPR